MDTTSTTIVQRLWNCCNVLRDDGMSYGDHVEQLKLHGLHLETRPLVRADLDEFVTCYHPENRHERSPTWSPETPDARWRTFTYDELMARDKANLDIFWLRDESLEDSTNLPEPGVLAAEIVEELKSALEQFEAIADDLGREE